MTTQRLGRIASGLMIAACVLFFFYWIGNGMDAGPPHVEQPVARPFDPVTSALGSCEQWTRDKSKLAVGNVTDRYEITGRKLKPRHVLVGIEYRTQGAGLLMQSECEFQMIGTRLVLLRALSQISTMRK